MKGDRLSELFHQSSRIILIIPFVVILLAIISRYQVFNTSTPFSGEQKRKTVTIVPTTVAKSHLDFNRDITCIFENKESTVSAFNKADNYLLKNSSLKQTSYYLASGDCIYVWKTGAGLGQKKCGIGQYLRLARGFFSTGLFDMDTIMSYLPKDLSVGSGSAVVNIYLKEIISSCKNKETADEKLFLLPKNIQFTEEKK